MTTRFRLLLDSRTTVAAVLALGRARSEPTVLLALVRLGHSEILLNF